MDPYSASSRYGLTYQAPSSAGLDTSPGIATAAGQAVDDAATHVLHPDHPLFWFGAILAATFGLIGLSVSGRVGPVAAGARVGKA